MKFRKPAELRILSLLSCATSSASTTVIGGGEIRAVEVLKKWHSWGVNVHSLESVPSPSLLLTADYTILTISLPFKEPRTPLILINALVAFIKNLPIMFSMRNKIDAIVVFNSTLTNVAPAWLFNRLFRVPMVLGFQISFYAPSWAKMYRIKRHEGESLGHSLWLSLAATITLRMAKSASAILCLSQPIADILDEVGLPKDRLHIDGMGLDLDKFKCLPEEEKVFDAIFLGRVERHKGIMEVLDAWKSVVDKKPNAKLVIVGAGEFLHESEAYVHDSNIESNVVFTGFIAGDERFRYLKLSKVCVYPSRIKEGWGLSISEALACGLPVICSDNPVFRSIFSKCPSVFFTPIEDEQSLAHTILSILDDEDKLTEYSRLSREFSNQFDWDTVAQQDLAIVRDCVESECR